MSFLIGWACMTEVSFASYRYLFDTVRRRMMTSGQKIRNHRSFIDAGRQIATKEGAKALANGVGTNILRSVAGVALYDKCTEPSIWPLRYFQ